MYSSALRIIAARSSPSSRLKQETLGLLQMVPGDAIIFGTIFWTLESWDLMRFEIDFHEF